MKVIMPQPFTYKAQNRDRAVLLLHGFTGSIIDVKMLGRYLQEHGYTCHAPLYKGHGADPEQLIQTGPEQWWEDVLKGYGHLISEGYEEIAVAGISLGGVFSLKLASEIKVKAAVSMCAPMLKRKPEDLYRRVLEYAVRYKEFEGKSDEQIELEMEEFKRKPMTSLQNLQQLIIHTRCQLSSITSLFLFCKGVWIKHYIKKVPRLFSIR